MSAMPDALSVRGRRSGRRRVASAAAERPQLSHGGAFVSVLVRPRCFVAPRGYMKPIDCYRSRFGFLWWFWLPRLHTQRPDDQNARVIRLIWLCFAVGVEIWGPESRRVWPNAQRSATGREVAS